MNFMTLSLWFRVNNFILIKIYLMAKRWIYLIEIQLIKQFIKQFNSYSKTLYYY